MCKRRMKNRRKGLQQVKQENFKRINKRFRKSIFGEG